MQRVILEYHTDLPSIRRLLERITEAHDAYVLEGTLPRLGLVLSERTQTFLQHPTSAAVLAVTQKVLTPYVLETLARQGTIRGLVELTFHAGTQFTIQSPVSHISAQMALADILFIDSAPYSLEKLLRVATVVQRDGLLPLRLRQVPTFVRHFLAAPQRHDWKVVYTWYHATTKESAIRHVYKAFPSPVSHQEDIAALLRYKVEYRRNNIFKTTKFPVVTSKSPTVHPQAHLQLAFDIHQEDIIVDTEVLRQHAQAQVILRPDRPYRCQVTYLSEK